MRLFPSFTRVILSGLLILPLFACGGQEAPPPPPLFPVKGNVVTLGVGDVVTLQDIQEQALWMQALAGMAVTHSDSDVIHAYTAALDKDYKAQQDKAEKIAKSANLVLQESLDSTDQSRIEAVRQSYKKSYDRGLIRIMSRPMLDGLRKRLEGTRQNGRIVEIRNLAGKALSLYENYRTQAVNMKRAR